MREAEAKTEPTGGMRYANLPRGLRAFRHPEFRVVWSTFIVGQLGFWVSFVSLQALMSRLTDADGLIAVAEPRADGTLKPVVGFRGS